MSPSLSLLPSLSLASHRRSSPLDIAAPSRPTLRDHRRSRCTAPHHPHRPPPPWRIFSRPIVAANSTDILYEIKPFIKVYKNGVIERLTGTETTPSSLIPISNVLSKDVIIQSSPINISARLFLPKTAADAGRKLPLLVYFHGGAFFTSSPFNPTYHNYIHSVVAEADVVAVSVDYCLAPEHPLPAAYHDSWRALEWVFSHSKKGNGEEEWLRSYVDFEHVYLAGDSAGGNIAHNVAVRAGSDPGVVIHGMFLNCPHFWGKTRIGNEASYPKEQLEMEEKIWTYAYPNSTGFDDPMLNPNFDPNLGKLGCKKVLVYVAEKDVLRDRGLDYKKALEKTEWDGIVKTVEVKGQFHVFNLLYPDSIDAKEMLKHMALFLNDKEESIDHRIIIVLIFSILVLVLCISISLP